MKSAEHSVLRVAVAGHTNTGKTSLLRTLTRDPEFGRVADAAGTTRHVEGVRLLIDGQPAVEFFDTPGMEDGIALRDYLDQLGEPGERLDGPQRIRQFLNSPGSTRRFEQEARVVRTLLECDAALYVVDVRDPVLGKHKDELAVLADCGQPLLPVLNFTQSPDQQAGVWRDALARLGLHVVVEFDTIAPALDGEARLYDKLALVLDAHATLLNSVKDDVQRQRDIRRTDAARLIAELLIDAAAWHLASEAREPALTEATATLRKKISAREGLCVKALLDRYNFRVSDFPSHTLPLQGERWGMDLFHPAALKEVGIHVTKGIVAGAMAGATVDIFTAGLSLGSAALLGGAVGGLWQGGERLGKRILGRLQGFQELSVDDTVLRLLAVRQLALVRALERRGHAAQQPVMLDVENRSDPQTRRLLDEALPAELSEARGQPQWSSLSDVYEPGPRRARVIRTLAETLAYDDAGAATA